MAGDNEIIFNDSLLLQEQMHIIMIIIIESKTLNDNQDEKEKSLP